MNNKCFFYLTVCSISDDYEFKNTKGVIVQGNNFDIVFKGTRARK